MIKPEQIRWRVVRDLRNGLGQVVGYISGRDCMVELDALDKEWSVEHTPIFQEGKLAIVHTALTVHGITRTDVGVPSSQDKEKGAYSDGLKRAAVAHGIGRELYDLPQVFVPLKDKAIAAYPTFNAETGRWEVVEPGFVRYPEDRLAPDLDEVMTGIKALIAAKPSLKERAGTYGKVHNLDKDKLADMEKLLEYLTAEAEK